MQDPGLALGLLLVNPDNIWAVALVSSPVFAAYAWLAFKAWRVTPRQR